MLKTDDRFANLKLDYTREEREKEIKVERERGEGANRTKEGGETDWGKSQTPHQPDRQQAEKRAT